MDLPNPPGVEVVKVESATEMHQAVTQRNDADVIVMAAAVADFRPKGIADSKIKKDGGPPEVVLEQTVDILADLGARKQPGQIIVGFAAETDDLLANAKQKLERKKIDLIVANDVSAPEVGFAHETNEVTILETNGCVTHIPLRTKRQIADELLNKVLGLLGN